MSEIWRKGVLAHHGIKGQKWGVRRFQNEDGSLTPAGKSRYYNEDGSLTKEGRRHVSGMEHDTSHLSDKQKKQYDKLISKWDKIAAKYDKNEAKLQKRYADPHDGFKNILRFLAFGPLANTTENLQNRSYRLEDKAGKLSDKMYKLVNGKEEYKKKKAEAKKAQKEWLRKAQTEGVPIYFSHSDEADDEDLRDFIEFLKEDDTKDMVEALDEKDRIDFLSQVAGVLTAAGVLPDSDDEDDNSTTEDGVDGE